MGYDVELIKGTKLDVEKSPVIRAKKQKKSEKSGDEDWHYLIGSKHHELCFGQTQHILGFGQVNLESDMQTDFESYGEFILRNGLQQANAVSFKFFSL